MNLPRLFFKLCSEEVFCFDKQHFIDEALELGKPIILHGAQMLTGEDYFFCSVFSEFGLREDSGCGIDCAEYKPRNGKNGRCRYSKNCYEPSGKKYKVILTAKIIEIENG